MTILLLDGDTLPALAITRSLGSRGIPVVVASHQKNPIAGYSRYASRVLDYTNPLMAPDWFVRPQVSTTAWVKFFMLCCLTYERHGADLESFWG